jgi:glutathione synthase/RimK-type ligase-like ATP-grasp enzyme
MPENVDPVWLLICNPENRRKGLFEQGLFEQALFRKSQSTFLVISYEELLLSKSVAQFLIRRLENLHCTRLNVKIESPGENFEVTNRLTALGTLQCSDRLSYDTAISLTFDKGRFRYLKEWSLGFHHILREIEKTLTRWAVDTDCRIHYLNTPQAILSMLDKHACQRQLQAQGITSPALVSFTDAVHDGINAAMDFRALTQYLVANHYYSVFIKPRYGSSAAGVMALRMKPDGSQYVLRTSLELVQDKDGTRCYNSLKVRTYTRFSDIAALYKIVVQEGAYIERWLPKAQLGGLNFDLRVVVINGKASHYVTRCSKSPMTNLHLGNQRGDVLNHPQGNDILSKAYAAAESAVQVIAGAGCVGVDIVISGTRLSPYVIELNAFGDLLPEIFNSASGRPLDTYQFQIQAMSC